MLQAQQLPRVNIFRDYGELIRLVTRKSVPEFAKMMGVSASMIYSFESCRTYSQKLLAKYNKVIEEYEIDKLYEAICSLRNTHDCCDKWGDLK